MENEVILKHSPVREVILKISREGVLKDFYKSVLSHLNNGNSVKDSFKNSLFMFSHCLKKEDEEALIDFSNILGATDMEGQIRAFSVFKILISKNLNEAEKLKKEKMKSKCAAVVFVFAAACLVAV